MSTSKNKLSDQTLVRCAMIAAVYTVLCLVLQPFSYGAVQVRVAEAFCLLPVFGAEYIVGVTLGCLLANLLGSTMVDVDSAPTATMAVFNAVAVGVGEIISCCVLGVALVKLIESNESLNKIFAE